MAFDSMTLSFNPAANSVSSPDPSDVGRVAGRINIHIGTAGWSIPRASAARCPDEGTHLQRYARVFRCAEINSSFHRPHAASTYAKWAASTPPDFRFAVKVPRTITHDRKLRRVGRLFADFLQQTDGLGSRRGPLLVQFPPSFAFDARVTARFFATVRSRYEGLLVCEPRHPTWFSAAAGAVLRRFEVGRVATDPSIVPEAKAPGGWDGVSYFRLHGAPRMYWSRYDAKYVAGLATRLRVIPDTVDVWCVFDNTASGAALDNAWELQTLLS